MGRNRYERCGIYPGRRPLGDYGPASGRFRRPGRITGSSIGVLNVQKRIKLLSTDLSIAEVSERSGYGDYRVFTKVFKKSEGVTPSQYRRDFLEK